MQVELDNNFCSGFVFSNFVKNFFTQRHVIKSIQESYKLKNQNMEQMNPL